MRIGFRELIFLIVLLAVPVASFIYVFKPRNDEIRLAKDEVELKQAKMDQLHQVTSRIADMGQAIEEGRKAIEMIEAKLPSEQDVEGILEQVWQIAKKNRLVVKSVKSDKPVPAAMYMEQPLKVVMEGDFDGYYQFLLELENLPRITRVHSMKLERIGKANQNDGTPAGGMKAEFTLSIYFQPLANTTSNPRANRASAEQTP